MIIHRIKRFLTAAAFVLSLSPVAEAVELRPGGFSIVVSGKESAPVMVAVQALCRDFEKVTGSRPCIASSRPKGVSIVVRDLSVSGRRGVRTLDGEESHRVYVEDGCVYLCGADMRGTIYAIYTFSEKVLGVPPAWYFCHWKPVLRERVDVPDDLDIFFRSPEVRFRAWFPNDTDLFTPWRKLSEENDELWMETMLRMKLNTVEMGSTVNYAAKPRYPLSSNAALLKKYGLILTSHHFVALNTTFGNWERYWTVVRGMPAPELSVKDTVSLREFWTHAASQTIASGQENIWQVGFRGAGDQPFWALFKDAPESEAERGALISRMMRMQMDIIRSCGGGKDPFVRMTFYDEISDMVAAGHVRPPEGKNVLRTFVAARRDHYPNLDIVSFNGGPESLLGYYFNCQFTSTGSHLAAGEGPWKMEANYRYVASKGRLVFSVVNAGNLREFIMEMNANASMMWDMDAYGTDKFLKEFCATYFGKENAEAAAAIWKEYYDDYWRQRPSDFPGMDRQYIFQDLRYDRAMLQICDAFHMPYTSNPFKDYGFERKGGRTFNIAAEDKIPAVIDATAECAGRFAATAAKAVELEGRLPEECRPFFRDMVRIPCRYMTELNLSLNSLARSYRDGGDRKELLDAMSHLTRARKILYENRTGVFEEWYAGEKVFGFERLLGKMEKL